MGYFLIQRLCQNEKQSFIYINVKDFYIYINISCKSLLQFAILNLLKIINPTFSMIFLGRNGQFR